VGNLSQSFIKGSFTRCHHALSLNELQLRTINNVLGYGSHETPGLKQTLKNVNGTNNKHYGTKKMHAKVYPSWKH
jgi:hypothetical protein